MKDEAMQEMAVYLNIRNNPLKCDPSICWLLDPGARLQLTVSEYPCASPPHFTHLKWADLTSHLECGM